MTESRLYSFFEWVDNINFHAGGYEHKLDLAILKHVEYFVEQHLLSLTDVVIDIFEHEKQGNFWIFGKVLLNLRNHLYSVKLLWLFFETEGFAKLHQNFIFISFQKGRIDSDYFQLLIRVILLKVLTTVYDNLTDQVMHYLLRSCEDK